MHFTAIYLTMWQLSFRFLNTNIVMQSTLLTRAKWLGLDLVPIIYQSFQLTYQNLPWSCEHMCRIGSYRVYRAGMGFEFSYTGTGLGLPQFEDTTTTTTDQAVSAWEEV